MNPLPEFFTCWVPHWSCDVTDLVMRELNVTGKMDYRDAPGYMHFKTRVGVEGLGRIVDDGLELLAVNATKPGTGQFRQFIVLAKERFPSVTLWSIMNDEMMPILARYGFSPCIGPDTALDGSRSTTEGMRWRKMDQPKLSTHETTRTVSG